MFTQSLNIPDRIHHNHHTTLKIKSERAIIPAGGDAMVSYGTTTSSVGVWILLHSICSASPLQNGEAHSIDESARTEQSNRANRGDLLT